MSRNQKNPESGFKTVFYKDVEFFVHRDTTQKPVKLRLYDALSGLFVASELSKAEADQLGSPNAVRGKNEQELVEILENRIKAVAHAGESFKAVITRSRNNMPIGEKQQAILKAYQAAKRDSTNTSVASVTKTVALVGNQLRKEVIKMPAIQERRKCNLLLHCGSEKVDRIAVARVTTPQSTETWFPIPHCVLLDQVESALRATGFQIGSQVHSLSQDGNRYFGLTQVRTGRSDPEDYTYVIGLRNSHDRVFPAGLVIGNSVLVCDNLSFLGTIKLSRKHTRFIERDLPQLVGRAVGQLMDVFYQQDQRIEAYKNYRIRDKAAHDIVVRSVDLGAATNRMIPAILKEYREPRHPEFQDRTGWSLFNAFTEVLKGNLPDLPKRTQALHALFDTQVKLTPAQLN